MEQEEVVKALDAEILRAESFTNDRIAHERAMAYDYYYGREFGNEMDGRSRVVSCDVAQAVDAALPPIVEIFVSGDKAVEFAPRNQEDVASAEQATTSANYVFFTQNNGYALTQAFIKDGLLQKTGYFYWRWEDQSEISERVIEGISEEEAAAYSLSFAANGEELVGATPREDGLLDLRIRKTKKSGKVVVDVPAPEDMLISPDSTTLNVMEMPFIGRRLRLTRSDLVKMGIEPAVIDTLTKADENPNEEVAQARKDRTGSTPAIEGSQDEYIYDECFFRVDEDDDGVAELRKICKVGKVVLEDEPTDHVPIAVWTPKLMPHEVIGVSLADDVMDLQLLKSSLWRGINDSLYQSIAPRMFIQGDVNMDDVLTVTPGGVIRGEMNSALTPITVPFVGQQAFPMLEYADQEKDARVGFSAMGPGMDPDSINKTATFVREMTNQTNSRAKLIARNAAEFGFKPMFRGILYLLARHQTQALMVRLNNKFVPVDPETWNKEYDMTCNVGLGMGSKDQQLMQLQALGMDLQSVAQSPFASLLLDAQKIYNFIEKKANLAGFKDVTVFLNNPVNPDGTPMQPPPPGKPESVQVAEVNAQAKMQGEQVKAQGEVQKIGAQAQTDQMQAVNQLTIEREKLAAQMQFEREKLKAELEFKMVEKQMELAAQKEIAILNAQVQANRPEPRPGA